MEPKPKEQQISLCVIALQATRPEDTGHAKDLRDTAAKAILAFIGELSIYANTGIARA
jgi:hypothetical protein